jgi:hypothetical protein
MLSTMRMAGAVPPIVETLYEGFAARDPAVLLSALDPDFTVSASSGMPLAVGRVHTGALNAVTELWGVVHRTYDIAPIPDAMWTHELVVELRQITDTVAWGRP